MQKSELRGHFARGSKTRKHRTCSQVRFPEARCTTIVISGFQGSKTPHLCTNLSFEDTCLGRSKSLLSGVRKNDHLCSVLTWCSSRLLRSHWALEKAALHRMCFRTGESLLSRSDDWGVVAVMLGASGAAWPPIWVESRGRLHQHASVPVLEQPPQGLA